jgi:predicted AAA+ superfamily ATPase
MERIGYNLLIQWKNSKNRKPLIVNGARQVGKTWLLNEFAKREYKKKVMFSLDRHEKVREVFTNGGSVEQLLRALSALSNVDITPNDTLIILDEIQECPQALTALKYFCEDAPDIHIAVAGSLLGISLHKQSSFPVGKVDIIRLYPMNFEEFLRAVGRTQMADELLRGDWSVINLLEKEYIDLLRQYYYVGGMPAAVLAYLDNGGLKDVRQVQKKILADYEHDFSKYAPQNEVPRIRMVWQSIPSQLAKENKKFIYGALKKGARAAAFEVAIQWLVDAGLVYKICRTTAVKMPLKFYENSNAFKLFLLDVGLMGAMVDAPASAVLVGNEIFSEYKGAFTELFVAAQLMGTALPVFYHSAEDSRVELDFVVQIGSTVYPVEAKSEENLQSKSMKTFIQNHPDLRGIRLSMKPHISQDWLECIPLYAFCEEFKRMQVIEN